MSEVRWLMEEWGVGEDFGVVVFNSGVWDLNCRCRNCELFVYFVVVWFSIVCCIGGCEYGVYRWEGIIVLGVYEKLKND